MFDDWVEGTDGTIYWDENATSQETTKSGERYLGKEGYLIDKATGEITTHYNSDGTTENYDQILTDVSISANKSSNNARNILTATLIISGTLFGDDITGIGVLDDILIPAVFVGGSIIAVSVWVYDQMGKSRSKNEKHGDGGRSLGKAEKQIHDLENQLKNAKGSDKIKIKNKLERVKKDAQRKSKGEEHSRNSKS
jgi:hypothetical protein